MRSLQTAQRAQRTRRYGRNVLRGKGTTLYSLKALQGTPASSRSFYTRDACLRKVQAALEAPGEITYAENSLCTQTTPCRTVANRDEERTTRPEAGVHQLIRPKAVASRGPLKSSQHNCSCGSICTISAHDAQHELLSADFRLLRKDRIRML